MTIVWGRRAYDDLDAIADYLTGLSPGAAERIINRIQKAISMLGDFPDLGAKVDETGLRRLVISGTPYVVFYRIFPGEVDVRGIFHAGQRRFLE
ncbi:MAG TPA: type II toxin-antitoxin system RelE/ParE family toxin [Terriglobia bacterium]|nr:type II toxin-antitoxin system RelE/ParE family toxin [Terriglobia bacterium]